MPEVRKIFANFRMESVELKYTIGASSGSNKHASEVIIYNFEKSRACRLEKCSGRLCDGAASLTIHYY